MSSTSATFDADIQTAYEAVRDEFARLRTDDAYTKYVVPPSTAPHAGFTIFYNPPTFRPPLLVIGLNPANFAPGESLTAPPNAEMLSGLPPTVNSYIEHEHFFAKALQAGFAKHGALFVAARGMNLWYFQTSAEAAEAPRELRDFCSAKTRHLVFEVIKPDAVLCLSSRAFASLTKGAVSYRVPLSEKARFADVHETRIWYSYHPTASRPAIREIGIADLPVVLDDIAKTNRENRR